MDRANSVIVIAVLMLVAGAAGLGAAMANGDADLNIVVIVPVISGTGGLFAVSALLFFGGVFLVFLGYSLRSLSRMVDMEEVEPVRQPSQGPGTTPRGATSSSPQWGGVIFIGPIPIAFGSNPGMNRLMLVAAIVMALLFFVFLLGALR
jgi:uncharacterized protein (TIGR00304 family)